MFFLHRGVYVVLALVLLSNGVLSNYAPPIVAAEVKGSPQSDELIGLKLGGTPQCGGVEILGIQFKSALVYGRSADLTKLLVDVAENKSMALKCTPPCDCLLVGPNCLISRASRSAILGTLPPPPPGTVIVVFNGDGDPGPPRSEEVDSMMRIYESAKKKDQCEAELCASTKGEMSVTLSCGDVKLKLSSSGKASASITKGNLTVTIP